MNHAHGPSHGILPPPSGLSAHLVDPVCGMSVDPATAAASSVHDGKTYYFCSPSCKQKFDADPRRFLEVPAPRVRAGMRTGLLSFARTGLLSVAAAQLAAIPRRTR